MFTFYILVLDETMCYNFALNFLSNVIYQSSNNQSQWEISAHLLNAVLNKLSKQSIEEFAKSGSDLLVVIINVNIDKEANVISSQLSCISALTIFLPFSPEALSNLMKKVIYN